MFFNANDNFDAAFVVDLLASQRRENIHAIFEEDFRKRPSKAGEDLFKSYSSTLFSPLYLPTLIAGAQVGIENYEGLLEEFCSGNLIDGVDERCAPLRFMVFSSLYQAEKFMELESLYYLGLYCFLLFSFVRGGKNMTTSSAQSAVAKRLMTRCYSDKENRAFAEEFPFSPHDIRWNAWAIFNPVISIVAQRENSKMWPAIMFNHGFSRNSLWHNVENICAEDVSKKKSRITNETKRSSNIDRYTRELRVFQYLHLRSKKMYWWNPIEIDAHRSVDNMQPALNRLIQSQT